MPGEPKGPDYSSQPPQEGGQETQRGNRLATLRSIVDRGQNQCVVVKPKGETDFHVAWINIKPTVWGTKVFLVYRDQTGVVVPMGNIDRGWEVYLDNPLDTEVYEYTGE